MNTLGQIRKNLNYVLQHPFNRDRKTRVLMNWIAWQAKSRILHRTFVHPFVNKAKIYVRHGMTGATGNIHCGLLEWEEMGFALHFLRESDIFADVGSNVGVYTVLASGAVGAYAHTFEPIPSTFAKLKRNIELNHLDSRVSLYNIGVSDTNGILRFTTGLDTGNHVADPQDNEVIQVEVKPLDKVLTEVPALIKIDVEGHEVPVLNGAVNTISSPDQQAMIIEWNRAESGYGDSSVDIFSMLNGLGYTPVKYDPYTRNLTEVEPDALINNALFIKNMDFCRQRLKTAPKFNVQGKWI